MGDVHEIIGALAAVRVYQLQDHRSVVKVGNVLETDRGGFACSGVAHWKPLRLPLMRRVDMLADTLGTEAIVGAIGLALWHAARAHREDH